VFFIENLAFVFSFVANILYGSIIISYKLLDLGVSESRI